MKRTSKFIVITILLIIFTLSLSGCNWFNWWGQDSDSDIEFDPNGGNHGSTDLPADNAGGGVAIPGWSVITIPSGETEVAVDLPNPSANADKYYLSFEMRLADTGEVLFTTGYVLPGQSINKANLSRPLDAGIYDVIIRVQPCRPDGSLTNNADMSTVLIVK
jgi:hypothetical protein